MCVRRSTIYHSDYKQANIYSCAQLPTYIPTQQILDCLNSKHDMPLYNMPRRPNKHVRIVNNDRRRCCDSDGACAALAHKPCESQRDPCDPCVPPLRPLLICKDCGCCYRERTGTRTSPNNMQMIKLCGYTGEDTTDMLFTVDPEHVAEKCCDPNRKTCPCENCCRGRRAPKNHAANCECRLCRRKFDRCLNTEYFKWERAQNGENVDECCDDDNEDSPCSGSACTPYQIGSCGQSIMLNGAQVNCHCCIVYGNAANSSSCSSSRAAYPLSSSPCCRPIKHVCRCCYCQIADRHMRALHGPNCCCQKCVKYRREVCECRPSIQYPRLRSCRSRAEKCGFNPACYMPQVSCCGHGPLCTCSKGYKAQAAGRPLWCRDEKKCLCHSFVPFNWDRKAACDIQMCSSRPGSRSRSPSASRGNMEWPYNGGICEAPEIDLKFKKSKAVIQVREESPRYDPYAKSTPNQSNKSGKPTGPEKSAIKPPKAQTQAKAEPRPKSPSPAARRAIQTKSDPTTGIAKTNKNVQNPNQHVGKTKSTTQVNSPKTKNLGTKPLSS